jgi:hypothetical protein
VVVLTSKDLTRDEHQKLRQDADEIIAKGDLDLKDLAAHIRTLVNSGDSVSTSRELGQRSRREAKVEIEEN